MGYGFGAYKKTSITTAAKEEVLLLLYRGAIKHAKNAVTALEKKDIKNKSIHIGKFQDIIIELSECLDFKIDEQDNTNIALELGRLYDYMCSQATQASIQMEPEHMRECLTLITTLYEGWTEAIKQLKKANNLPG